ncbi:hypothetical protein RHMOL_Rhmol11G0116700 [Rhododendron molle]|uniref:Uncharacterized protein n=1 Tax=Rhododendron molle TaxID=49168 RepID=A0ACC0LS62_RHOML|nr:hypothetical protein RHMOL_Rhmol11G0116700 [Rhododendron molle]
MGGDWIESNGRGIKTLEMATGVVGFGDWDRAGDQTCHAMADTSNPLPSSASEEATVHIIYTQKPSDQDPDSFHISTLASVLGSEEAAKEAMLYSYKHAASGFSAKLTPEQVSQMSKLPGVLQVVPSRTVQLHSGTGKLNV